MDDIFKIIFGNTSHRPRGETFFESLRAPTGRGESLFRSATPFVTNYEWCKYQKQIQHLGELRRVSKAWNQALLPHCLCTLWFTHPSQVCYFLERWGGRLETGLVRHLRFDWGIPLVERIWVVGYIAPKFEGWWHREVAYQEYCSVPRYYDATDRTAYEDVV
ncbi:hypothetical protein M422DRAFT_269677 [Sphaerobolus stellatus SS14]|uniref:Unplaced genomic scaffold SPHSTscaffold_218, whole genome shotgun sequence n=1 Tax=Sphaerobolus stellatus (strain SS14) TaxID=990650 RepID=A0A0C9THM2_SPHS4|nr:hypothetical protein M422DRAFT_269677 [Sphaerobolus stellatus SS14]